MIGDREKGREIGKVERKGEKGPKIREENGRKEEKVKRGI